MGGFCFMRLPFNSTAAYRAAIISIAITAAAGFGLLILGANARASGNSLSIAAIIPGCTPISFGNPSELGLTDAAAGLTIRNDQPTKYQVYGDSAGQLRTQIQHCGPHSVSTADAGFTAQTAYTLSWQYEVRQSGSQCSITDVKVGLHTSMALPFWQPTPAASDGLAGRWQRFDTSLQAHEQGHVGIDESYAAKLAASLQNISDTPCHTVTSTVRHTTDAATAALDQANDAYDASTDHGATQGAILPAA